MAETEQPKTRLCRACFDGDYPIPLPAGNLIGKHVLEGVARRVDAEAEQRGDGGADRGAPGDLPLVAQRMAASSNGGGTHHS